MALWTHRASFSWRQNLAFFERRYEILRSLESEGLLRRFDNRGTSIAVRVQGPHQLVIFGEDGLFIGMYRPDALMDVVRSAATIICNQLEPRLIGSPLFRFQWLESLSKSYDEARRDAADAFLGGDHPGNLADFALLVDAKLDAPFDDGHIEFGIVDANEAPMRLGRETLGMEAPQDAPPGLWGDTDELPAVASFCDVRLDTRDPLESSTDIVATMFATFEQSRDAADRVRASLLKPLEERPNE